MQTLAVKLSILAVAVPAFACSSSNDGSGNDGHGGAVQSSGGSSNTQKGGDVGSGGTTSSGGTGSGGTFSTGLGGTTGSGGSNAAAGNGGVSRGGSGSGNGGSGTAGRGDNSGGASTGGRSGSGGRAATGGTQATGSGGTQPTGGSGTQPTGGGGARATGGGGGSVATGGQSGTAGSAPLAKFVGNITTGNVSGSNPGMDQGGRAFSKYWDQVTPENAGKWGSVQSSATAQPNWGPLKAIYDYCQKNKIIFKQHTFVWGSQQPSGTIGEADVKAWMKGFCTQFPETKMIDVVNEAQHAPAPYANNIGGGNGSTYKWITNAYIWAREACPNAELIFNDYNIIEHQADSDKFINIVKTVMAAGGPIDAVGAQGHDLDLSSVTWDTVLKLAENVHSQTGLPMYITEYDISMTDDNAQLAAYKQHFTYFLQTEWIKGITVWGWIYGQTWSLAPDSGLIKNGNFRPAMTWLMQQLGRPTT